MDTREIDDRVSKQAIETRPRSDVGPERSSVRADVDGCAAPPLDLERSHFAVLPAGRRHPVQADERLTLASGRHELQRAARRALPCLDRPNGEILVGGPSLSLRSWIGNEVRDDAAVERPQRRKYLSAGDARGHEQSHGY